MSHFKAKMHQIRFLAYARLSQCPFCLFVFDGVWHYGSRDSRYPLAQRRQNTTFQFLKSPHNVSFHATEIFYPLWAQSIIGYDALSLTDQGPLK